MLPRIKVNVSEEVTSSFNTTVPFSPAVIIKTITGPINEVTVVNSESEFITLFGSSDTTVPSAYAIQAYLRSYSPVYVCRVAAEDATTGTATLESTDIEPIELLSVITKYKTASLDGTKVYLKYDSATTKLFAEVEYPSGKKITSIKETFVYASGTADTFSTALSSIILSLNELTSNLVFTKIFDAETDEKPATFTSISVEIEGGNSGNTSALDEATIPAAIAQFDIPDSVIDTLSIPGATVAQITAALEIADKNAFVVIAQPAGTNYSDISTAASSYPASDSLILYGPSVRYTNFDADVPADIAVLTAYAKNDNVSKWGAPAGTNRATLPLVTAVKVVFKENEMAELYDSERPVNTYKYISGTGYVVWGQKTTSTATYRDRVNISRLVKYCTRQIYGISNKYIFEPINDSLYKDWTVRVSSLLETLLAGNAITDYIVKMDSQNNTEETMRQNQLVGLVKIKPLEVAEFIDIDFVITDSVAE